MVNEYRITQNKIISKESIFGLDYEGTETNYFNLEPVRNTE